MARAPYQGHRRCRRNDHGGEDRRTSSRRQQDNSRFEKTQRRHGGRPSTSVALTSTNLTIRPIPDDKEPNVFVYNEELRRMHQPTWRNVSWLYSECYLYRYASSLGLAKCTSLLRSMFASTTYWKNHDAFFRQKDEAFKSSQNGVLELAERFWDYAASTGAHFRRENPEHRKFVFVGPISESC